MRINKKENSSKLYIYLLGFLSTMYIQPLKIEMRVNKKFQNCMSPYKIFKAAVDPNLMLGAVLYIYIYINKIHFWFLN